MIQEGDDILLKLPSGNIKLAQIKGKETITLGKFGSFNSDAISGKPLDLPYQILSPNSVSPFIPSSSQLVDIDTVVDNRNVMDSTTAQNLSQHDIKKLKQRAAEGKIDSNLVVKSVTDGNANFTQKTEFSKEKYVKRKESKFDQGFIPLKSNAMNLSTYYFAKSPSKILYLQHDTLSLTVNVANIHPGAKVLTVDDSAGVMTTEILQRLGGTCLSL